MSTLKSFLDDPARPDGTLGYHELQGFLYAVACSPELVMPSDWLKAIFDDHDAAYQSMDEARTVLGEIMAVYNDINARVLQAPGTLPADCRFRRTSLANLDEDAPIAQWSRGFLQGHDWLEDVWAAHLGDAEDEDGDFGATLMTLTFFASRRLAEAYATEFAGGSLAELARAVRRVFPDALADYAACGRFSDTSA
jgi:yecA family protein